MKGGGSGGWGGRGEEEEKGGKLTKEMCGWLGKTWQSVVRGGGMGGSVDK